MGASAALTFRNPGMCFSMSLISGKRTCSIRSTIPHILSPFPPFIPSPFILGARGSATSITRTFQSVSPERNEESGGEGVKVVGRGIREPLIQGRRLVKKQREEAAERTMSVSLLPRNKANLHQ